MYSFHKGGYLYLIFGMITLLLAFITLYYFLQAQYFQIGWWNGGSFYQNDVILVIFGTYLLPLSLILLLVFANLSFKNINHSNEKVLIYIVCIFIFSSLAGYGYYMSRDVFNCLGYFCMSDSITEDTGDPSGSNFVGLLYFLIGLFFDIIFGSFILMIYFNKERVVQSGPVPGMLSEYEPILSNEKRYSNKYPFYNAPSFLDCQLGLRKKYWSEFFLVSLVFLVLYPLLFVACLIMPTGWNNFSQYGIQSYQHSNPDQKYGTYIVWYANYTYFKLYPDILVFYGSIYLVVALALLCKLSSSFRSFFYHIVELPSIGKFSVAQIMLTIFITLLLLWQFFYFYYDHVWENADNSVRSNEEICARCLGQVSNMIMGLLTLPVSKNSIWSIIFDMPWSNMIVWHQVFGYLLLIVIGLHMLFWWAVFDQQGIFPKDILAVPGDYHQDNFTIPLAQITYFIMLIVFGVFTFYLIRRWSYELFYYSHLFSTVVFLVVLWHSTMSWYYITAGLVLWAVDIFVRTMRTSLLETIDAKMTVSNDSSSLVLRAESSGSKIIQLSYKIKDTNQQGIQLNFQCGQFCWINIPEVSIDQWHPFTISAAPVDTITTHHIKVLNNQSNSEWTNKLEALSSTSPNHFTLNISGPFGHSVDLNNCSNLLLVGAGIGITPLHSYLRQLYIVNKNMKEGSPYSHIKRVRFIWTVRTLSEFEMFEDIFRLISNDNINDTFSTQVYITDKRISSINNKYSLIPITYGRPGEKNFIQEVDTMKQSYKDKNTDNKRKCLMLCSGPSEFVDQLTGIAFWNNIEIRTEQFLL